MRSSALVGALGVFAAATVALSQGLSPDPGRVMTLLAVIVMEGVFVLCTLAACAGYGYWLRRAAVGADRGWAAVQLALGLGAVMMLAWLLGWAGWLNGWMAWIVVVAGWALWVPQLKHRFNLPRTAPWPVMLAMPAAALLIVAATLAPGTVWQPTEHNAYDVLSYHLQLPRQWMADGAVRGYEHNVYSFLPGGFETMYLFLGHLRGRTMVEAALACQLLHACTALLAAAVIAQTVTRRVRRTAGPAARSERRAMLAGPAAAALYLAVPWVAVTGSLAYNDQAMLALGAAGLAVASDPSDLAAYRRGAAAGLLCGTAMLAKLTAVGLFAAPVLGALVIAAPMAWRRRALAALACLAGAALPLALFMTRNGLWTGNPVFPMACEWFGNAHWTRSEVARWGAAHMPDLPWLARFERLWTALLAHRQFGYVVFPAGAVALVGGALVRPLRRISLALAIVALMQLLFWLAMTHVQSRFAIAVIVPLCIAIGMALSAVRWRGPTAVAVVGLVMLPTLTGYGLYMQQHSGRAPEFMDGTLLFIDPDDRPHTPGDLERVEPYRTINHPSMSGARIYAEGFAAVFYVERPITYHTVFDASPLGRWIERLGPRGAVDRLRRRGHTHLMIHRAMLARWRSPGNYGYDERFS
ncbi:MAG: hypothetical protein GVY28_08575, partial [Alphaproteobacteria bacterium]|nr:hypothetical protein [Alphaproteobacteria bacterium]